MELFNIIWDLGGLSLQDPYIIGQRIVFGKVRVTQQGQHSIKKLLMDFDEVVWKFILRNSFLEVQGQHSIKKLLMDLDVILCDDVYYAEEKIFGDQGQSLRSEWGQCNVKKLLMDFFFLVDFLEGQG